MNLYSFLKMIQIFKKFKIQIKIKYINGLFFNKYVIEFYIKMT